MSRRSRKRVAPRVVIIDWSPELADIFALPTKLGLTPPAAAKCVFTSAGSTWSAQFRNTADAPVNAHVRLKHGPLPLEYDPTVVSERIDLRFVVGGAK